MCKEYGLIVACPRVIVDVQRRQKGCYGNKGAELTWQEIMLRNIIQETANTRKQNEPEVTARLLDEQWDQRSAGREYFFTRLKWKFLGWYLEVKLMRQLWYRSGQREVVGEQGTPVSGQWQARVRAITLDQMTKSEAPVAISYVKNTVVLVSISNSLLLSQIIFKSSDSMVITPSCYHWWSNEPFLFSSW